MAVFAFCNDGDVVFDVGANIGSVSIPCAKKFNVYAFEPFKITHDILVKNIRANKVQKTIKVFNVAVGDKRGKVSMDTSVKEMDGTEVKLDFESKEEINYGGLMLGVDGQEVDMITLDSLMNKVSNVKLMKVDVEGAEPLVFYGAREIIKRDMPIIIFEKTYLFSTFTIILKLIRFISMYYHHWYSRRTRTFTFFCVNSFTPPNPRCT